MGDSHRVYFGSAFLAGVLVTVAIAEIYHRYQQQSSLSTATKRGAATGTRDDEELLNSVRHGPPAIVEGVEGCIGNTPLFRIKSLSDETGCEILAKAEVSSNPISKYNAVY